MAKCGGELTPQGTIGEQLSQQTAIGADTFFSQPLYVASITDWPSGDALLEKPVTASGSARISIWRADPADQRHIPAPGPGGALLATSTFSLMSSGNGPFAPRSAPGRSTLSLVTTISSLGRSG